MTLKAGDLKKEKIPWKPDSKITMVIRKGQNYAPKQKCDKCGTTEADDFHTVEKKDGSKEYCTSCYDKWERN